LPRRVEFIEDKPMSDIPTEHFEHAEHAKHAFHAKEHGNDFIGLVTITIAILAVAAATVGSLETIESGGAISSKNEAVLLQNKATDQWNFYQSKSLKKNMYEIAAATPGPKQEEFLKQAKKNEDDSADISKEAKRLEADADMRLKDGDRHEERHHILTIGVTLLHVSIAVSTIAIISGKRWPWFSAIALGIVGVIAAAGAYLVPA
jgi:hypothetical protein